MYLQDQNFLGSDWSDVKACSHEVFLTRKFVMSLQGIGVRREGWGGEEKEGERRRRRDIKGEK